MNTNMNKNNVINVNSSYTDIHYVKNERTFYISERYVAFDTTYVLVNNNTGNSETFKFSHSTGPEFDPSTEWVYKTDPSQGEPLFLKVVNDANITKAAAGSYLSAKLKN